MSEIYHRAYDPPFRKHLFLVDFDDKSPGERRRVSIFGMHLGG